jgi:hypothetical protein
VPPPAHHSKRLDAAWRRTYVVAATTALPNVFVLIVQTFLENPALAAIAPTQSELPFVANQGLALIGVLALGAVSIKRFQTH